MSAEGKKVENIIIKNKKILDFYKKYKEIDIEKVNLLYIELFENFMSSTLDNPTIITSLMKTVEGQTKDITNVLALLNNSTEMHKNELTSMKTLYSLNSENIKNEIEHIKTLVSSVSTSLNSTLSNKIYETKDNYLKELKELLINKENGSIVSLNSTIEKQNSILIDKLSLTLNEIIPKSNTKNYEDIIKFFKDDMKNTLDKINDPNSEITIDKISNIIDNKYNSHMFNLQEHLMKYIGMSEERLNTNLHQIKDISSKNSIIQEKMSEDFINYLNRYKTGSFKGTQGENKLYKIINDEYSSAELTNTSGLGGMGDMILKRVNKIPILIETKEYTTNVKKDEVEKFLKDVNNNKCCGIFLSQSSGIVGKDNFEININNKNILIFVHNVDYDVSKIKLAINTIDLLMDKLKNVDESNVTLSTDILNNINKEYQTFIFKKNLIISNLKDYYKKTLDQYCELILPNLEIFLSNYYADNKKKISTCEICKTFQTDSLKSLARHIQSCKKKIIKVEEKPLVETKIETKVKKGVKTPKEDLEV